MKRCPACNATYGDEQNFCLSDGSTLVSEASGSYGTSGQPENPPYGRNAAPTQVMYATPTAPPTQPAPQFAQPMPQKRSPLPWILGGAVLAIGIAVAIIFLTRSSGSDSSATTTSGTNTSTTAVGNVSTSNKGTTTNTNNSVTTTSTNYTYNAPDGRFSIMLPSGFSQFTSQTKTQPTLAGPIELTILQSEIPSGACVVGYSDFPESSFQGRTPQKMLEDGRDGAFKNMGATIDKQENLTVQGRTGINVYGSATSGGKPFYVRFEFILDKPRAYQIGYLAYNRADLDKPDVQAYFDSFNLK